MMATTLYDPYITGRIRAAKTSETENTATLGMFLYFG
jgi:hypothetical protein